MLTAFNQTRQAGRATIRQMLRGINLGSGVVGAGIRSAALRANSTTRPFIANGNVGALRISSTPTNRSHG
jgi:hypothetical protein